jgi:hypothetical protein
MLKPEDGYLLACSAVSSGRSLLAFQRQLISLMMEAASTSETLVNFYQTTRRYIPEDSQLHNRRRENLKSYWVKTYRSVCLRSVNCEDEEKHDKMRFEVISVS